MDYTQQLAKFNKEVDDFVKNIPVGVTAFQKKVVLEALRRVIIRTPVDTGRARGNWQVSIGEPAEAALIAIDKDGGETIAKGLAAIAQLPPYSIVWISNNVNYIEFLEYGRSGVTKNAKKMTADGHSTQAPKGMVALTIVELREMFEYR